MKLTLSSILASTGENERFIVTAIEAHIIHTETLRLANEERSQKVTDGIKAACDSHLPKLIERGHSRRELSSMLQNYLRPRLKYFELDSLPHIRTIREVVKKWEPPNGDTV